MIRTPSLCKHDSATMVRIIFLGLGIFSGFLAENRAFAFPEITVQPAPLGTSSNSTVAFALTAIQLDSSTPLSVQWRRNGVIFTGGRVVTTHLPPTGLVTSTLTISNVQPADCGAYSATVYDPDGAISSDAADLTITNLLSISTSNLFILRPLLGGAVIDPFSGSVTLKNIGAQAEIDEPENLGIPGGSPVWLKWIAPTGGIARFGTGGSDFDTTIGIYVKTDIRYPDDLTNLTFIAGDDDSKGYFNSSTIFTATANAEYEIMVDGFHGSQGNVVLNWSLEPTTALVPQIWAQPQSTAVSSNMYAFLSVYATSSLPLQYSWYFNGKLLTNQTLSTLFFTSVTPTNIGEYQVAVTCSNQPTNEFILSQPAEIQINGQNYSDELAEGKFLNATGTNIAQPGVKSPKKILPSISPARGYTGSQVFNTYGASSEPGAPNPCGVAGGSPYWFWYQAPADGTLAVDADTPTFTNVLAVYTGPGDSYATLVPVACADTNAGTGHEVTAFTVNNGSNYWIVVSGRNGQTGNVTLTYNLLNAPSAPAIVLQPQSQTAATGSNATLTAAATGTPTPGYQWFANTMELSDATNTSLTVSNFQATNQGDYELVATNVIGAATSSIANLRLNLPLVFLNIAESKTNRFGAILVGAADSNYVMQSSSNLVNWNPIVTNSSPYGIISLIDTNTAIFPPRFFRAMLKTN